MCLKLTINNIFDFQKVNAFKKEKHYILKEEAKLKSIRNTKRR